MHNNEKRKDNGSKAQADEHTISHKEHNSSEEMPENSRMSEHLHESEHESGHKTAGGMMHEGRPEDQTMHTKEKSLDHEKHAGMKPDSSMKQCSIRGMKFPEEKATATTILTCSKISGIDLLFL